MLRLVVGVPESRDRAAVATLRDGLRRVLSDLAVASVAPDVARRRGNPTGDPLRPFGHPAFGTYRLIGLAPTPAEGVTEYGSHLLAFEPQAGPALEAESFGRLVLLAYAGPPGRDARPRRTQGGVRVTTAMLEAIVSRVQPDTEVELRLEPLGPPPWWAFGRRRAERGQPLSAESPRLATAPLDEETLAARVGRRARRSPKADTLRDSGGASTDSRDSARESSFEGRGGQFGGAGASGGWESSAGGTTRVPGVDASGRIIGAAAGAAAAGGLLAAAAAASSGAPESEPSGADAGSGGGGDAGTQVNTAY